MSWKLKKFADLTVLEFHNILKLRTDIFVVEQDCPYPEVDGKDLKSLHLMYQEGDEVVAYARLLPPGVSYGDASIGRVVVAASHRGTGLGHELLKQAVKETLAAYHQAIRISAQAHLEKYYAAAGFVKVSGEYLEDNIPHVEMLLEANLTD